jgi:hypothetical protein
MGVNPFRRQEISADERARRADRARALAAKRRAGLSGDVKSTSPNSGELPSVPSMPKSLGATS